MFRHLAAYLQYSSRDDSLTLTVCKLSIHQHFKLVCNNHNRGTLKQIGCKLGIAKYVQVKQLFHMAADRRIERTVACRFIKKQLESR